MNIVIDNQIQGISDLIKKLNLEEILTLFSLTQMILKIKILKKQTLF